MRVGVCYVTRFKVLCDDKTCAQSHSNDGLLIPGGDAQMSWEKGLTLGRGLWFAALSVSERMANARPDFVIPQTLQTGVDITVGIVRGMPAMPTEKDGVSFSSVFLRARACVHT